MSKSDRAKIRKYTDEEKSQFASMAVVILSPIMIPEPLWIKSMVNMVAFSWMQGLKIYQMGLTSKAVIDWARNDLADMALNHKCDYNDKYFTHFLWLDADHTFNPDLACELAAQMVRSEVDAIGPVYYARRGPTLPVVFVKDDSPDEFKHYPIIEIPPTLCEVDAIGFGACLMKRSVFEKVPKPWFTLDFRAGEDIAFCVKAKKHGIRFFCHGGYTMGHIGEPPIINKESYRKHMDNNKSIYADRIKVNLGGEKVK